MGTREKLISRFVSLPKDFTWDEMQRLLISLGYYPDNKGKTSGSRIVFKGENRKPIMLHKPHPGKIMKHYALRQVLEYLTEENLL